MDAGTVFLIKLCVLEAKATWLWLTMDRKPGHQPGPAPRSFIRAIMGAQILDAWRREDIDLTPLGG